MRYLARQNARIGSRRRTLPCVLAWLLVSALSLLLLAPVSAEIGECDGPRDLISHDLNPELVWLWSIRQSGRTGIDAPEIRLYQRTERAPVNRRAPDHGAAEAGQYLLVAVHFGSLEELMPSAAPRSLRTTRILSLFQRPMQPYVADVLTRAIHANLKNFKAEKAESTAAGASDAFALEYLGFDGKTTELRTQDDCVFPVRVGSVNPLNTWQITHALLNQHAKWQLGLASPILQATAAKSIDEIYQPQLSQQLITLYWQGVVGLYLTLALPALMSLLMLVFRNRPKHPLRFVWACTMRVYGISAMVVAGLSPFMIYAMFLGGARDFGGIPIAAAAGGLMLGGGVFAWIGLSLILPIVMRWRRQPRDCFEPD